MNRRQCLKSVGGALLPLGVLALAGCPRRQVKERSPLAVTPPTYLLAVDVDLSGSMSDRMLEGRGEAWNFCRAVLDQFHRDQPGDVRILVAQISSGEPLLWEGTPQALRRDFPSASAFKSFLRRHTGSGSDVFGSIAALIRYVRQYPGVAEHKTRTAVLCLTDMLDTGGAPEVGKVRLENELEAYAKLGGAVGLYWVDNSVLADWKSAGPRLGFPADRYVVEPIIVSRPTIPSFDR